VTELINLLQNSKVRYNALYVLTELGAKATSSLPNIIPYITHGDVDTRLYAVEALGVIGSCSSEKATEVTHALIQGLSDNDDQVRFTAALSLARLRTQASAAVSHLVEALDDYNRYVQAYALMALVNIGTKESQHAVIDHLSSSRWCPLTNINSTF